MSTTCCPLENDQDDRAKVFTESVIVGRKDHKCYECHEVIPKGTKHESVRGLWDGGWSNFRTCLACVEIRNHFGCDGGWIYGQLWGDLEDNFFPDMRAGGPCMSNLSPMAKAKMFAERMRWIFTHDEYEPEGFALPPHLQPQKPPKPSFYPSAEND